MAVEYKFKPYTPKKLKIASTKQDEKLKRLEAQKTNLDARLRAQGIDPVTLGGDFDNRGFLEKALNLRPDQGFLMDFFEVINRPVEAVKAGIMAGLEGKDVIEGAFDGLAGNVVTPGSEFAEEALGIKAETGVGKFITSVAVDIFLDPITYLPAGFFLKRIGKMFSKTVQKTSLQLTGEMLTIVSKYGLTDAAGNALKNADELSSALAKLTKEQQSIIINQLDAASKIKKSADVIKVGKAGDFSSDAYKAGGSYENTIKGLQERADWLRNTQSQIDTINAAVKKGDLTAEAAAQKIKGLLPESFGGSIQKNVLGELQMLDEVSAAVKQLGDDYVSVITSTANQADDVAVLRKLKIGDEEYYVKVMSFDSKVAEGAAGATATIALGKSTTGKDVIFSQGDAAFKYADDVEQELITLLKNDKYKVNFEGEQKTLYEVLEKVGAGRRAKATGTQSVIDAKKVFNKNGSLKSTTKKKLADFYGDNVVNNATPKQLRDLIDDFNKSAGINNSFNPYKLLEETYGKNSANYKEGKESLDALMKKMNRAKHQNGEGYIYLAGIDGRSKGIFVKFKDVEDYLDYSQSSFQWTQSGKARVDGTKASQFRFRGQMGMDTATREQLLRELPITQRPGLSQIFSDTALTTGSTKQVKVSLLDYLQDKPGIVGDLATVTNKAIKGFQGLFDPYAFLPKETQDVIRRMRGQLAVEFNEKSLRLAGLEIAFKKAFPNLDPKVISEIIQAGAYIDDTGVIQYATRTMDSTDYVRHMLKSLENGKPFQLRNFSDLAAETNFVNTLNDLMDNSVGVDNLFTIVEKNGVKALGFTGTKDDLVRMLGSLELDLNPKILNFGKINLSDDGSRVLKEWGDINETILIKNDIQKMLVDEGGFTNFLFDGKIDDTYLRHILTKDAYEYMIKNTPGVLSKFAKPGSNVFQTRKFLGTIDEANDFLKAYYDIPMDVFDPNFFRSTEEFLNKTFRTVEQGKMMDILLSSKDKYGNALMRVVDNTKPVRDSLSPDDIMIKSFKEEFSPLYKNLSPEAQEGLDKYLRAQGFGNDQAIVINRSMQGVLKQVEKAYIDLPAYIKVYDKFLNTWKGLTLITPGFHMRNLFGNSFNSYAVGMDLGSQIRYARVASLELTEYNNIAKILAEGGELTAKQKKLYETVSGFRSSGLLQSHRGIRDLEQVKEASVKAGKQVNENLYNKTIRFNFNIAEKMDDTQRYILYRWSLDKTGDTQKAIDIVAEALFDYSRLTGFEKDVLKRIFPFYTFMKNNFIFQAKNILRNPQQYARTGRAYKYYLEDIAGYSPEDLPDYVTDNMWLPIPMMVTKNDKEGIAFLKANLPLADFTELVENPFKKGVISITTPIKLAIELGIGRDLFTGAPLERFPGETNVMQAGTGVFAGIRDRRGSLAIAQTPIGQKILNDLGLRTPLQFGSVGLDILDTAMGYQGPSDGLTDFLQRSGITSTQELSSVELTKLYQDLENLRELKKYYEQETGNQLPILPRG